MLPEVRVNLALYQINPLSSFLSPPCRLVCWCNGRHRSRRFRVIGNAAEAKVLQIVLHTGGGGEPPDHISDAVEDTVDQVVLPLIHHTIVELDNHLLGVRIPGEAKVMHAIILQIVVVVFVIPVGFVVAATVDQEGHVVAGGVVLVGVLVGIKLYRHRRGNKVARGKVGVEPPVAQTLAVGAKRIVAPLVVVHHKRNSVGPQIILVAQIDIKFYLEVAVQIQGGGAVGNSLGVAFVGGEHDAARRHVVGVSPQLKLGAGGQSPGSKKQDEEQFFQKNREGHAVLWLGNETAR